MTKKKGIGFNPIKEALVKSGKEILRKKGEQLLEDKKGINFETVLQKLESTKSEIKKNLLIYGLFGLGGFFVLLGLAKYLPVILGMSEAKGFIIIGTLLILIGFIYRAGAKG